MLMILGMAYMLFLQLSLLVAGFDIGVMVVAAFWGSRGRRLAAPMLAGAVAGAVAGYAFWWTWSAFFDRLDSELGHLWAGVGAAWAAVAAGLLTGGIESAVAFVRWARGKVV